ncbi:MAG: hypothetical protein IAE78_18635 [Myxococcus sp.]|nr:hypothetical protein [Myxococcus sp.]
MRHLMLVLSLAVSAVVLVPGVSFADTCVSCGSGSSNGCQQCRMPGGDTQAARKECEKKGCKITGTSSCSSAANVKVCKLEVPQAPIKTAMLDVPECRAN